MIAFCQLGKIYGQCIYLLTFQRMSLPHLPSQLLLKKLLLLLFPPLQLLYPLKVVVYGHTQDLFRSFLANNELIQMLL